MFVGLLTTTLLLLLDQARAQAGGQAQGVDIEVLSHICKYGVHTDGRRYSLQSTLYSQTIINQ